MRFTSTRWMPLQIAVATAVLTVSTANATIRYDESQVHGPGREVILCDLDGDHLKDIVLEG